MEPYLLEQIIQERQKQIKKGFDAKHDDKKSVQDWTETIHNYISWAKQMYEMNSPDKFRKRMLQAVCIGIACLECYDRTGPHEFPED